jgi:hypothetical protein
MMVREFMHHDLHRRPKKRKGDPARDRTTYRAARRNIAKISYRRAKRGRALAKRAGL